MQASETELVTEAGLWDRLKPTASDCAIAGSRRCTGHRGCLPVVRSAVTRAPGVKVSSGPGAMFADIRKGRHALDTRSTTHRPAQHAARRIACRICSCPWAGNPRFHIAAATWTEHQGSDGVAQFPPILLGI